jgi:hypothetical protein
MNTSDTPNLEGTFGYDKIMGHFNCDDTEKAARHPNTNHFIPVDTDGFPTRRLETVNFHPPFEHIDGTENTESGESFWHWMDSTAREEGELREEPVDYGRFDEEDADGFKHRDYQGYGRQRRGNVEWRDERRREEAEQAKDAYGLPIYGMTKTHYEMHYLPTGRLVERTAPTEAGDNETTGNEHDQRAEEEEQDEAEEAETSTTQSPTMHTRRMHRSRTPARRLNVLGLMLIASPTTEALHQQAGLMTAGTETMTQPTYPPHGQS